MRRNRSLGDFPAGMIPPDDLRLPSPAPHAESLLEKIGVYLNGNAQQFPKVIGITSERALKANRERIGLEFFNISANIIRINYGGAAGASSIPIPPLVGGIAGFYAPVIAPINDIYAIAAAAGSELIIVEYVKFRSGA